MNGALASVVMPAHDEARVIGATLEELTRDLSPGTLDVVVVCNGCTDDTAAQAVAVGEAWGVRVVSIQESSKTAALNLGDELTSVFPRIYLDADVHVSGASVVSVADFLRSRSEPAAARPVLEYDTTGCDRLTRAYYRARSRTPSLMNAVWGAGFYAVNEAARQLWDRFPDDQADDIVVEARVGRDRFHVIDCEAVVVTPPRNTKALLLTLGRVLDPERITILAGPVAESDHAASGGWSPRPLDTLRDVVHSNRGSAREVFDATSYVLVTAAGRVWTRFNQPETWARDDTTR